ncbi:MAG: hypothetical protein LBT01_02170 [Spirochaetaceae bacterium]|jgi:hypothetical protein|nr:hypothetical protein [Spirochaetaceae bacterium]
MRDIKTTDGREILLPKNDFLFKLIFGDERALQPLPALLLRRKQRFTQKAMPYSKARG